MGVHNSWMVYFMENPKIEWMMTGGTPFSFGNHQIPSGDGIVSILLFSMN